MKQYSRKVFINGLGIDTPIGKNLKQVFDQAVRSSHEIFSIKKNDYTTEAYSEEYFAERLINMCVNAIESALLDWGGNIDIYTDAVLILGSGLGLTDYYGNLQNNEKAYIRLKEELSKRFYFLSDIIYFSNACSASSQAICYGADLIGYEFNRLVIVGGVEVYSLIAEAGFRRLNAIDNTGCKPFAENRKGISVGEGAVFFVLESIEKTNSYAEIGGYGTRSESYDIVRMEESGRFIVEVMCEAVDNSSVSLDQIDVVVAHGTGTDLNDFIEGNAIKQLIEQGANKIHITAPKGLFGHTGGASGAIGMLIGLGIIKYNKVPPIKGLLESDERIRIPLVYPEYIHKKVENVMVNCFAFGGTNYAIMIKATKV